MNFHLYLFWTLLTFVMNTVMEYKYLYYWDLPRNPVRVARSFHFLWKQLCAEIIYILYTEVKNNEIPVKKIIITYWKRVKFYVKEKSQHTRAVLLLLSDSFGSRPRLSNWFNSKSSPLSVAKHKLRGRSILPRASMCSVSSKTPSIIGSFCSFKCCHHHQTRETNKNTVLGAVLF